MKASAAPEETAKRRSGESSVGRDRWAAARKAGEMGGSRQPQGGAQVKQKGAETAGRVDIAGRVEQQQQQMAMHACCSRRSGCRLRRGRGHCRHVLSAVSDQAGARVGDAKGLEAD